MLLPTVEQPWSEAFADLQCVSWRQAKPQAAPCAAFERSPAPRWKRLAAMTATAALLLLAALLLARPDTRALCGCLARPGGEGFTGIWSCLRTESLTRPCVRAADVNDWQAGQTFQVRTLITSGHGRVFDVWMAR